MNISEEEIQSQIESSFAQNLEALKMEGGHALSADLIQSAKIRFSFIGVNSAMSPSR